MRKIYVCDCETDPFDGVTRPLPFLWGLYTVHGKTRRREEYHEFTTTAAFVEHIQRLDVIVYAHNGGRFDFHYLLQHTTPLKKLRIIDGRVVSFRIGRCELRDSYALIPVPLSEYRKTRVDYAKFHRDERHKHMPEISAYLRDDCVFTHELVMTFVNEYGTPLTQASAAMRHWTRTYNEAQSITHHSASWDETMRDYYAGGRCETFQGGLISEPFDLYDINSAYPFAMTHDHPFGASHNVYKLPRARGKIERLLITVECESLGAFPYRERTGAPLAFPHDGERRTFTVSGWEYLAARDLDALGKRPKLGAMLGFYQSLNFTPYVEHFHAMKEAAKVSGDRGAYLVAKIFLNALYGKFASDPSKYWEYILVPPRLIDAKCKADDWLMSNAYLGDLALLEKKLPRNQWTYYHVGTGASITGFVRAYLWRAIVGARDPLYCDTDSLACRGLWASGTADHVPAQGLGSWEHEYHCTSGHIAGKKLYAFNTSSRSGKLLRLDASEPDDERPGTWKLASKGVRLTPREIQRVANGDTVEYASAAPRYSFKSGIFFPAPRRIAATTKTRVST